MVKNCFKLACPANQIHDCSSILSLTNCDVTDFAVIFTETGGAYIGLLEGSGIMSVLYLSFMSKS